MDKVNNIVKAVDIKLLEKIYGILDKNYDRDTPDAWMFDIDTAMEEITAALLSTEQPESEVNVWPIENSWKTIYNDIKLLKSLLKSMGHKKNWSPIMGVVYHLKDEIDYIKSKSLQPIDKVGEIKQLINDYWKFDDYQQPMSSWHDKQNLLDAVSKLSIPHKEQDITLTYKKCIAQGRTMDEAVKLLCEIVEYDTIEQYKSQSDKLK